MYQTLRRYIPTEEQIRKCNSLHNGQPLSWERLVRITCGEHLHREAVIRKIQEAVDTSIRLVYVTAQPLAQTTQQEQTDPTGLFPELQRPNWEEQLLIKEVPCTDELLIDTLACRLNRYGNRDLLGNPYDQPATPGPLYFISLALSNIASVFFANKPGEAKLLAKSIVAELKEKLSISAELTTSDEFVVRSKNGNLTISLNLT